MRGEGRQNRGERRRGRRREEGGRREERGVILFRKGDLPKSEYANNPAPRKFKPRKFRKLRKYSHRGIPLPCLRSFSVLFFSFPPSLAYLLSPSSFLLSPTYRLPPPASRLLPLTSRLLPPASRLPPPASRLLPPAQTNERLNSEIYFQQLPGLFF
jgi:hypothetical protein